MTWRRLVAVSIFGFLAITLLAQIGLVGRDGPAPSVPPLEGEPLRIGLDVQAPAFVEVGQAFDVRAVVTNQSGIDRNFRIGMRGGEGVEATVIDALGNFRFVPAGAERDFVETFVARQSGRLRIEVSAREEAGWSAAGAVIEPTALVDPSFIDRGAMARVSRFALVVRGSMPAVVEASGTFPFDVVVRNTGDLPLDDVRIGVSATGGFEIIGPSESRVPRLEPGLRADFRAQLRVPETLRSGARVSASSRDGAGWAAAGTSIVLDAAGVVRSAVR